MSCDSHVNLILPVLVTRAQNGMERTWDTRTRRPLSRAGGASAQGEQ